jgi:formylglycine-generating enzyme required for sulfatase activity
MGCNEKVDRECSNDEKPGREVYLDAYAIDSNEVMVAEYRRCVEAGACPTAGLTEYESCNWDKKERQNHPINCVNWQQAQTYCQWAGKRLPTEAEWEKAARGTDSRLYPWGNEWDNNKANVGTSGTTAVGSYAADTSPYRVNDMAGNVWEWVQDWYAADYYKQGPVRNPKGPTSGQGRVVRGGSWL